MATGEVRVHCEKMGTLCSTPFTCAGRGCVRNLETPQEETLNHTEASLLRIAIALERIQQLLERLLDRFTD